MHVILEIRECGAKQIKLECANASSEFEQNRE
jgi:hypothetical protein